MEIFAWVGGIAIILTALAWLYLYMFKPLIEWFMSSRKFKKTKKESGGETPSK